MIVKVENVTKKYNDKVILENINLEIKTGDKVVILGKSGSGKTTLLNIISTIDTKYNGEVLLFQKNISKLNKSDLSKLRRDKLGFVFQDYGLLENLTSEENILMPSRSAGIEIEKDEYYFKLVSVLNIEKLLCKYPSELSGGEKQRISIARAIVKKPELVIADEITSALDPYTSRELLTYLSNVVTELKITFLMVTHDLSVAEFCDTYYFIKDKKIIKLANKTDAKKMFFGEI